MLYWLTFPKTVAKGRPAKWSPRLFVNLVKFEGIYRDRSKTLERAFSLYAQLCQKYLGRGNPQSTDGLASKSWDVFATPDAPHMDLVITVCDNAAGEVCPYWPGQPATAHWGYADPSEAGGTDAEKLEAFKQTLHQIKRRLDIFMSLPLTSLSKMALEKAARELAKK
jgi:hypothetical protein